MTTEEKLKEPVDRSKAFMVLGTRREGGSMAPVLFVDSEEAAKASASALQLTGWYRVEVWKQVA